MTDEELDRMRAYAEDAKVKPSWCLAYAQDVPKLLAALDMHRAGAKQRAERELRLESEIRGLAEANERLKARERQWPDAWHRLRFAEMVLDRVGAEIDGVPWREAARLSESLDGEPVTDAEPLAKRLGECEHAISTLEGLLAKVAQGQVTSHGYRPPTATSYVTVQIDEDVWGCIRSHMRVAPSGGSGVQSGD